ncbi:MAG: homoserine kinase [Magnetospirillum sp. WYHS-4]
MAVFTSVPAPDLARFLALYDLGEATACEGIVEGWENSNFHLETTRGRFVLTLFERRVDECDLPFFLGLMEHLGARNFPCPRPMKRRDGGEWGRLCGKPAAIVSFLEGEWPRSPSPADCAEAGRALGRLHRKTGDFHGHRTNTMGIGAWRSLFEAVADRADSLEPGMAIEIEADLEALERNWPSGLPLGVIHGDLFPDNTFFRDGRLVGVIDFYFACRDALAVDLAIGLNAWCFDGEWTFDRMRGAALLAGYREIVPIESDERAALPVLARGMALRFLLTRLKDWLDRPPGAMVEPKDPREYLAKLRFHRGVGDARDYGLD